MDPNLFDKRLFGGKEGLNRSPCIGLLAVAFNLEDCSDLTSDHSNVMLVPLLVPVCRNSYVYEDPGLRQDPGLETYLHI